MTKKITQKDFLLEIGTEELPVTYILPALNQIKQAIFLLFKDNCINSDIVQTYATARRLVVYIKKLDQKGQTKIDTVIGPPVRIAFDKSNKPNAAAIGFAKKFNVELNDLDTCKTEKGEYLCIKKTSGSTETKIILSENLPEIIKKIHFPKKMIWSDPNFSFARPIRWICALFGTEVVKINILDLSSDKYTYIKDKNFIKKVKITSVENYFKKLESYNLMLDHEKRREYIKNNLKKVFKDFNYIDSLDKQKGLLNEVNFLVEFPKVLKVDLKKEFLKLPDEVLLASMSKYQRVFGVIDKNNKVSSKFAAVVDGNFLDNQKVKDNYKMVLESRLQDSLFFFKQDLSSKLSEKVKDLAAMSYHKKLGSMLEKTDRIIKLSKYIWKELGLDNNKVKILEKAAFLCKADLTTLMVNEFPSLQGVMGKIYALEQGEDKEVAQAIYQHYLPRFSTDSVPSSKQASILSIADRIDALCGYFGIGLMPTGSYDPFALRRDAYAIVRIILQQKFNLKLDVLVEKSIKLLNCRNLSLKVLPLKSEVIGFILDKLNTVLNEEYQFPELIDAVLRTDCSNILKFYNKVKALYTIKNQECFLKAAKVSERVGKIYKKTEKVFSGVNVNLLKQREEKDLWQTYSKDKEKIIKLTDQGKYVEATKLYSDMFYDLVHNFFDKVLVNTDNVNLRKNRLTLCKNIHRLYADNIADLSLLENIKVS